MRSVRLVVVGLVVFGCLVAAATATSSGRQSHGALAAGRAGAAPSSCELNSAKGNVQHVIYVQFDNTHLTRDHPNVPSDLEQMPHLLNFIENNGVMLTNHHTPLISHTATDILTSLTGVYGNRHGVPVANSFRYFLPNGISNTGVSFAYWTDPLFDPSLPAIPTDTSVQHADCRRPQRAGALGAVHPRRLQRRHGRDREYRAGEQLVRHPEGVRHQLA